MPGLYSLHPFPSKDVNGFSLNAERARGRSPGSSLHPRLVFPETGSSDIMSVVGDYSGGAVLLTGLYQLQRSQDSKFKTVLCHTRVI